MKRFFLSAMALLMMLLMCMGLASPSFAADSAPIAENMQLKTYKNVSVSGCLNAYAPDGSELTFEITTKPVKGKIALEDDGVFTYTPDENKRGKDYFGYKAVDGDGNSSQEATVIIQIERQKTDVAYSDIDGSALEYAAVMLCENGVFTGEKIGGHYCFYPERELRRGEFLSMCMIVADRPTLSYVMSTGYADDGSIPDWMKTYVTAAAISGIDRGRIGEEGAVFDAEAPLTRSEAALILDKAMNLTPVSYLLLNAELEAETAQACANLSACGIIREGELISRTLTRGDAAQMLSKALTLKMER